jgi:hypothetical protein
VFSHAFYNVVHIVGIALVMAALGGAAARAWDGGPRGAAGPGGGPGRLIAGLHGLGALFILVGGFGMLARLGFRHGANFPGWLWVKLGVWATVAGLLAAVTRRPGLARPAYVALPVLAGLAAYMAIYKPL